MKKLIVVVGPTAVGKTKYALYIGQRLGGEIISADSMQIYKDMNIGSAKPTKEELKIVPHHLVDEISPFSQWSVADYQRLARNHIRDIFERGKQPIVSGGTGLYVNSLIYQMDFASYKANPDLRNELHDIANRLGGGALHERLNRIDPVTASRIHPNNIKKLIRAIELAESGRGLDSFSKSFIKSKDYESIIIGLNRPREILYERIDRRVDVMMEMGLLEEVKGLIGQGLTEDHNSMKGIGYKELIAYIKEEYSLDNAISLIKQRSRNYAKRQITWFKRYDNIRWYDICENEDFCTIADDITNTILNLMEGVDFH